MVVVAAITASYWLVCHIRHSREVGRQAAVITANLEAHHSQRLFVPKDSHAPALEHLPKTNVVRADACQPVNQTADQINAETHASFAYLLDAAGSDNCNLRQIVQRYGKPNSSTVVIGSVTHPQLIVLDYDNGTHVLQTNQNPAISPVPATVQPISLDQLRQRGYLAADCPSTSVNIVAHQDDDLLFMNPDVLHDIQNGACERTIFLTAGDAGATADYWLGREEGSQKAYSYMTPQPDDLWIQRIIRLADNRFVFISTPRSNPRISLIFFRLPDGNINGKGFSGEGYQSLAKLRSGAIETINSVDHQSSYTADQLTAGLASLIAYYQPDTIRSQSTQSQLLHNPYPDHSDHVTTGYFAALAYKQYGKGSFTAYHGYPIHALPVNLTDAERSVKEQIFFQYAKDDGGVCQNDQSCRTTAYDSYLSREYTAAR